MLKLLQIISNLTF